MKTQAARLDWSHESSGFILTIQRLAQPPTGSWSLGPWGCPVLASHLYPPSPRSPWSGSADVHGLQPRRLNCYPGPTTGLILTSARLPRGHRPPPMTVQSSQGLSGTGLDLLGPRVNLVSNLSDSASTLFPASYYCSLLTVQQLSRVPSGTGPPSSAAPRGRACCWGLMLTG